MKNLIFLLSCLLTMTTTAQKIDPSIKSLDDLQEYKTFNNGLIIQDGDYFKDNNGRLDSFLGEWTGTYSDKTLELEIKKVKDESAGYFTDILLIKYKIETGTGEELINTLNLPDISNKHIFGSNFVNEFNLYKAWYEGELSDCNQKGWAMIEQIDSQTIKLWIKPNNMIIDNSCPDGNIHILPTNDTDAVILTKQN